MNMRAFWLGPANAVVLDRNRPKTRPGGTRTPFGGLVASIFYRRVAYEGVRQRIWGILKYNDGSFAHSATESSWKWPAFHYHWRRDVGNSQCHQVAEAGIHNFAIYEKADRLGGTWRENSYPGVACDVPSHLYSYSFALNPNWSHQFGRVPKSWPI